MGNGKRENLNNLNWYPGHMKKTRELIKENLKLTDLVIEVLDARIPLSSRNPIIKELLENKMEIVILNKEDLADKSTTKLWIDYFKRRNITAISIDCGNSSSMKKLLKVLEKIQIERDREKTRKRPLRLMIVGVPNVGKSSLINRLTGKKSAKTGDRPGVTRGKQWLAMSNGMELLDTPGILWPKFEDRLTGLNLAFCGSIKDEIMDIESLCIELIKELLPRYSQLLKDRYKLDELGKNPAEVMRNIAIKRGFILKGDKIDYERTAKTLLGEFRSGKIGAITLEEPKAGE